MSQGHVGIPKLHYFGSLVTILRQHGMRVVICTDDHEPAHAHVIGDGEARIDIISLLVITQGGMSDRDVRQAVAVIANKKDPFLDAWGHYHG